MFKKTTCWIVLIYGVLLIGLGYLGYQNAGSRVSLVLGSGFGILIVLSAFLLFAHKKFGIYAALILTAVLTATFGIRYSMTSRIIPALLAVLSGAMLLFLLAQSAKWRKR